MDANHKKRLAELEGKGKLSKNEKTELEGLKKHQADCLKAAKAPAVPAGEPMRGETPADEPMAEEPKVVEPKEPKAKK